MTSRQDEMLVEQDSLIKLVNQNVVPVSTLYKSPSNKAGVSDKSVAVLYDRFKTKNSILYAYASPQHHWVYIDIPTHACLSTHGNVEYIKKATVDDVSLFLRDNRYIKAWLEQGRLSAINISYDCLSPVNHLTKVAITTSQRDMFEALRDMDFDNKGHLSVFFQIGFETREIESFRKNFLSKSPDKPMCPYFLLENHGRLK
ncbi:MAG: hypothetical protein Q9222_002799 [Ikaeria aurantiellina]